MLLQYDAEKITANVFVLLVSRHIEAYAIANAHLKQIRPKSGNFQLWTGNFQDRKISNFGIFKTRKFQSGGGHFQVVVADVGNFGNFQICAKRWKFPENPGAL